MTNPFKTIDHGEFIIRPSTINDADSIINLERLVFDSNLRYGPSLIYALIHTTSPNLALTAVSKTNQIIGFIAGEIDDLDDKIGRIVTIEVHPNSQRNQIGTHLLQQFEKNSHEQYLVKKIQLQVHELNQSAITFYQLNEYKIIKNLRNYYSRGEHAYLMEKKFT